MSTRRVAIESDGLLEGILTENGKEAGAVICHPHPLFGGSMDNNVVEALEQGFRLSGFTTLRFNFRGVGYSEGAYDEGIGEVRDAIAACAFSRRLLGEESSLVLAGYSFGAWIAAKAALQIDKVEHLFLVAYPFSRYDAAELLAFRGKLYFVGGSFDEISPLDELLRVYKKVATEKYLKVVASSHFYPGMEEEIRDFVLKMFGTRSNG